MGLLLLIIGGGVLWGTFKNIDRFQGPDSSELFAGTGAFAGIVLMIIGLLLAVIGR